MSSTTAKDTGAVRNIALSRLTLSAETTRKTPPGAAADAELRASIAAHGLLENLVVRAEPEDAGSAPQRFAVVAGARRLRALRALATSGVLDADTPVPCKVTHSADARELSLAENVVRIAIHPADQVVAFAALADAGMSVAAIAARFGISERTTRGRLRLGAVAPEILDAYRNEHLDLEALRAFAVTTDQAHQCAVWERLKAYAGRPSADQVKRALTATRVPGESDIARFVGVETYEAAGGALARDLFADEDARGVWLEDSALLDELARAKLAGAAARLATRWTWAEAKLDVDASDLAAYTRVHPGAGTPTEAEAHELKGLRARKRTLEAHIERGYDDALADALHTLTEQLDAIENAISERAEYSATDRARAGCIVTIGNGGALKIFEGLVRAQDVPDNDPARTSGMCAEARSDRRHANGAKPARARIEPHDPSAPPARAPDPSPASTEHPHVGKALAADLRAIRTALVKAHLATNFDAAFDLVVFQMARSAFAREGGAQALAIERHETDDAPLEHLPGCEHAVWNRPVGGAQSARARLALEWMEHDTDAARFAALCALPRAEKEALFAGAVAPALNGQLAFDAHARPELEATIERLDIDFARDVRPSAALFWSRITRRAMLDIARDTFGPEWAAARENDPKAELAAGLEQAFARDATPHSVDPSQHAAACRWALPGLEPFDAGGEGRKRCAPTPAHGTTRANGAKPASKNADAHAEVAASSAPPTVERFESPRPDIGRATPTTTPAPPGQAQPGADADHTIH